MTNGETMETVTDFIFGGSKLTVVGTAGMKFKRHLFLGRKAMINLDSVLKSRDITLLTKVLTVRPYVFPDRIMRGQRRKDFPSNRRHVERP